MCQQINNVIAEAMTSPVILLPISDAMAENMAGSLDRMIVPEANGETTFNRIRCQWRNRLYT